MLSYGALFGILLLSRLVKKTLPAAFPLAVRNALADSVSAQAAAGPISFLFFKKIVLWGTLATLFVSPLIVFFLYFGLFGVIICLILPFLSVPFSAIMNALYLLIAKIVLWFSA